MNKETRKFIKKYGLARKNLSSLTLKQIFDDLGFRIIQFNKFRNSPGIQRLIDAYELTEHAMTRKAFIFVDNESKILFIRQYIGEDELIHYLLHELGHIWLKHNYKLYDDDIQEREADEFSVLVRETLKRNKKRTKNIAVICSLIVLAICVYFSYKPDKALPVSTQMTPAPPAVSASMPTPEIAASDIVCVTQTGKKYHRPDCRYVKNKTNITEISKSEAIEREYEPCKVCKP